MVKPLFCDPKPVSRWLLHSVVVSVVAAFGISKNPTRSTRLYQLSKVDELLTLMDESVCLHARLSLHPQNDEIQKDIIALRQKELVSLIEDAAMTMKYVEFDEKNNRGSVGELSKKLDEAILMGYQSTFTEEEFDNWVSQVEFLSNQYQQMLDVRCAGGGEITPFGIENGRKLWTVDELQVRFEQMRTLISPVNKALISPPNPKKEGNFEGASFFFSESIKRKATEPSAIEPSALKSTITKTIPAERTLIKTGPTSQQGPIDAKGEESLEITLSPPESNPSSSVNLGYDSDAIATAIGAAAVGESYNVCTIFNTH